VEKSYEKSTPGEKDISSKLRKVLVTEWIHGEKLASSSKETINRLIPVGIECFLTQLLETGNFHADPHPGNLLVSARQKLGGGHYYN
jgi:predicted unusual protein kinase regulating ubiquinone biosynthesis (AarF/ABC1/UbiB family)